ncbi:MAG: hypothetical protein OXJ52_06565, partial [Oligoflexia bacterium]|nr:hypothetical protein [Oligoflexia bacterium]
MKYQDWRDYLKWEEEVCGFSRADRGDRKGWECDNEAFLYALSGYKWNSDNRREQGHDFNEYSDKCEESGMYEDANGNVSHYTLSDRGQFTSLTDALG